MAYKPLPGSTRHGQRVDNPPLELNDTAKLRILLQDETQDWRERIDRALNEIKNIQETHTDRWQAYFRKEPSIADRRDIRNLWVAFSAVLGVAITLIALLLTLLLRK